MKEAVAGHFPFLGLSPFLGLAAFPALKLHSRPGRLLRTNVAQPARFVVRAKFCCRACPFLWSACLGFSALKLHSRPGLLRPRHLQACGCIAGQRVCWVSCEGCSGGCIVGQSPLLRVLQGPCFFQFWAPPFLVFAQLLLSSTLLAVQGPCIFQCWVVSKFPILQRWVSTFWFCL